MKNDIVQLNESEQIVGMIRRSLLVEFPKFIFAAIWILLPFFFLFPLLQLGLFGLLFFLALLLGGLYYALRTWLRWNYTVFVITGQRILDIEQNGIFSREVTELSIDDVSDVKGTKKGLIRRLFNVGDVRVETIKAQTFDLEISNIHRPQEVAELILEVQYLESEDSVTKKFHVKKIKKINHESKAN